MKFSKKITAGILTVCLLLNMISATGVTAYATEPTPTAEPLQTVEPIPTVEPTPSVEATSTAEPSPTVAPAQIAEPTPTAEPVARAKATHTHYVCGEETMICTHAGSGHTDTIEWTGVSGTKTATGTCNYYLTGDTTLTIQPSEPEESGLPSNDIKICLNGYNLTIKSSESYITWRVDELSICDCVGTGKITLPANKAFNGGTFYLYGGTITGNPVRVSSFATCFYMYGGTITDCEMGVFTAAGSYFYMYGGEITGCNTGVVLGDPDSTSSGSFYMHGGEITGNGSTTNASRGSGVLIHGGNFIMYDGEISGNQTGGARGAAVSIGNTNYNNKADATFTMRGGKITGNMVGEARGSAVSIGGATTGGETVYTFNMYGGEISGNGTHGTGQADAVVIDKNGRFTMTGGKITDNKNGVYMIAGVATASGDAYIYENDNRNLCLALDESDASRYLTIGGAFNSGAKIGVCVASGHNATITHPTNKTDVPEDVLTYLVSDTKGKELVLSNQVVTMATVHKHNDISFTEWTETTSLPTAEGNYFLTGDVTLSSGWQTSTGDTTLCLNGYDIIRDGNSAAINLYTSEGATKNSLTIYDCQNAGTITHTAETKGSGVTVDNSIFRMYGGSISGNSTSYGAGINMGIDAEVVLGGNAKIINNTTNGMGAAVYVPNFRTDPSRSGVITIGDNVEISGNRAGNGGGGVLFNGVSMTVSGNPTITGNYRGEGTEQADNVYLCADKTVTIGEAGLGSSAKIGVNSPESTYPIEITNAANFNYAANFVSDTSDYGIINSGSGDNQVVLLSKHTHSGVTGNFTAWTPKSGNLTSGKYFLSESNATALTENVTIPAGETVILCLNGNTLDMGSSYIENKGTLTICDCQDTQGSIIAVNTGISNKTGGTLTVSAGNITASDSMGIGIDNSGKATITGGTISGGSNGIHNGYGGTLTVTDGTLSGHYCLRNAATATVTGGTFSGKTGIYNSSSSSVLTVSGGKIETTGQAGLYLEYGTATITACEISAAQYGIQVLRGANVTIDPAKDSDIQVNSKGISIEGNFTHTGQITVKGGTFTSQNAVAVYANSKITIEGGIFTTNAQGEYALEIDGEEDYTQVVIKNAPDLSGGVQFSSGISKNLNGEYLLDVSEYTGTGLTLYFDAFVSYSVGDLIAKGSVDKLTLSKRGYYLEQSGEDVILTNVQAHTHNGKTFTKWTPVSGNLTSGTYYLSESNATALTGVIMIPAGETVTLCLNGNTLDMGSYYISVRGTLHIHDCKNTGLITSSNTGWIIYSYGVGVEGTFNLYGGTIKEKDGTTMSHGAIYALDGALTNIYGGTIESSRRGIYNCSGSTLHIYGGTITGTSSGNGIENNGTENKISTVNITGGTISGNTGVWSSNSYTSVKISGNPTITGTTASGVTVWGTDNVISGGTITGSTNGVINYETVSVTGGSITGAEYGIYNNGDLYLSGAPEISGDEEKNADIYALKGSIYAQSNDTTPVKYTGNNKITVKVYNPEENKIIVQNVDDDNKDKFELINTNAKYVLKQSGENLILALAHTHSWSYSVSGDGKTITANCTGTGTCNYTGNDKTLTIIAPVKTTYGDGKAENATLSATTLAGQSALPIVKYVGRGNTTYTESATAPTDAGTYTASITVGGKTASVDYEIAKAEPSVTWPAGLSIEVGAKLSDIDLSSYATADGSFSWKDGETVVTYSDTAEYPMTYTPNNENYNSAEQNVKVVGEDTIAPTGQISIKDNEWFKFWNTVTFGLFCKDYVEITITGADTQSGVDNVEYYLSDTAVSDTDIQNMTAWTTYEDSNKPSLEANAKKFAYAKITDKAGNVTYLSANGGVVVYTDSEQDTASVTYTLMTKENKDVNVTLNGNTIQSVSDGDKVLTEGVAYTVDGGKITLKGTYLETLPASDTPYAFTVSYHPYGETYVEATGNDAPATTTFTVQVEKYKIEKPQKDTTVFTYNGSEQTYAVAESEFYTVTGNQQTNADTYTVTIAIKDEFKNKVAWADGETDDITYDFVIGKAELFHIVWDPIATEDFVYDGEIISISLNYDGKYSGDDLRFSFLRTGDNINVTDEGFYWEIIEISGEDAKNYKFPEEKLRSPKYFITPRPLVLSDFTANTNGLVYTGNAMEPNVTSTNALVTTNDYTVAYENNTNVGENTAKIKITGKNNASGTVEIKFSIASVDPTPAWPTGLIGDAGKALSTVTLPDDNFSWKDGETVIVYGEETYYEMVYTPDDTDNYNVVSENVMVIGKDVTAPSGEITLKNNMWNSFMNGITFGLFFKETQNISITAADTESGIGEIAYHLATQELSIDDVKALGTDEWTTYSSACNVLPDNKYVVYARLSDNAGNVTYINSNGIVLYTDAAQDTDVIVYLLTTKEDKVVNVTLNGNTINSVSDGDKVLTEGVEYTVDGGKITLDGSYLDSHSYGIYTFTVTYKPLGEVYVDATGNSEPETTTFEVKVRHKWVKPNATPTPLPAEVPQSPLTEDNTNLWMWVAVMAVSGLTVVAIAFGRKRAEEVE